MKIKFPTIALLILSLAGLSLTPATAATDTSAKGITVLATGTAKVTPDTVRLSATISALAATNKEALAKANESASTFRTVLLAAKIAIKDIKTQSFSVSPEYNYTQDKGSVLIGYRGSQSFVVTIKNAENAGAVVDAVIVAGGNELQIQGVTPFVLDASKATESARNAAVKNAKAKATSYAKLLDAKLGRVNYLVENSSPIEYSPILAMSKAADSEATVVDLGEQDVTVSITIQWSLL